jgi:hypothetical protein
LEPIVGSSSSSRNVDLGNTFEVKSKAPFDYPDPKSASKQGRRRKGRNADLMTPSPPAEVALHAYHSILVEAQGADLEGATSAGYRFSPRPGANLIQNRAVRGEKGVAFVCKDAPLE